MGVCAHAQAHLCKVQCAHWYSITARCWCVPHPCACITARGLSVCVHEHVAPRCWGVFAHSQHHCTLCVCPRRCSVTVPWCWLCPVCVQCQCKGGCVSLCLCQCPSVSLSVCVCVYCLCVCLCVSLCVCVSVHVCIYVCVCTPGHILARCVCVYSSSVTARVSQGCLCECLHVCVSVYVSVCPSICVSVYVSVCLSASVCVSKCVSVHVSIYIWVSVSVCVRLCVWVCSHPSVVSLSSPRVPALAVVPVHPVLGLPVLCPCSLLPHLQQQGHSSG